MKAYRQEDRTCVVRGDDELVDAGYRIGFDDGFAAAVYELSALSEWLERRDGWGLPDSLIAELKGVQVKAFQQYRRRKFTVKPMDGE